MNIFIDFDHTLYNTPLLTKDMLDALAIYISKVSNENFEPVLETLKNKFKRGNNNIYDIYELIKYFSKIFNYDYKEATNIVNNVINNGTQYLFEDSIPFLKGLKKKNHKVYILSYNENEVYFQAVKIAGSGLLKYVDGVFPTTTLKGEIPLDFSKCIFIDDKPKDLISIYNNHPFKIFRIRRKNDTYSEIETNLPIPEFTSLEELQKNI
jgi:methionine salvage enolase-phosphatase E1